MSWVLSFDGQQKALSNRLQLSGDFDLTIENFRYVSTDILFWNGVGGDTISFNSILPCCLNDGDWIFRINGTQYTVLAANVPVNLLRTTYRYYRVGNQTTFEFGGASFTQTTSTADIFLGAFGIINGSSATASHYGNLELGNATINGRYYDVDNSDHNGSTDQPIIIETVGSNDATEIGRAHV